MMTAIKVNINKPNLINNQAIRLLKLHGYYGNSYNPHRVKVWLVQNDHITCLAIGSHEHDALDNIVNSDLWDSLQLSEEDYQEHLIEGWDDSYILLGNACEPFYSEYLNMVEWEIKQ